MAKEVKALTFVSFRKSEGCGCYPHPGSTFFTFYIVWNPRCGIWKPRKMVQTSSTQKWGFQKLFLQCSAVTGYNSFLNRCFMYANYLMTTFSCNLKPQYY